MSDALDGLLCHHGDDENGHQLDAECPVQVKAGTRLGSPAIRTFGGGYGTTRPMPQASGTCPECGRSNVKVLAPSRKGRHGPGQNFRVNLGVDPHLAPHKRPERGSGPCIGAGQRPTETRYRVSPLVTDWIAEYGQENVQ